MKDTALLIYSWDKAEILWKTTVAGLNKYWNDNPYPIYFITNFKDAPIGTTIKTGADTHWGAMVKKALSLIPESVIIWTCEDFWLNGKVDTKTIQKYSDYIKTNKADYIKLTPSYEAQGDVDFDSNLSIIPEGAKFRTSLGPSMWRKSLFEKLILPEETIWNFENHSAKRLTPQNKMYASKTRDFLTPFLDGTKIYKEQIQRQGVVQDEMAKLYCSIEGFEDYDK